MDSLAKRAYDHQWNIDPIVRNLTDLDFYQLLMSQMLFYKHKDVEVTYRVILRNNLRLHEIVNLKDLRNQLDYVCNLKFTKSELINLQGNTFYGVTNIFRPEYIQALTNSQLPKYNLYAKNDDWVLEFTGPSYLAILWESIPLMIVNELRIRKNMQKLNKYELDIMYSRAKNKFWEKLQTIKNHIKETNLSCPIADMGARRRHCFLWHEWVLGAMQNELGKNFIGTSDVYLAQKFDLEAIGTNSHSLPMIYTALNHGNPDKIRQSVFDVLIDWYDFYGGVLAIMLPDAYGTKWFLENIPVDLALKFKGSRLDSLDNDEGFKIYHDFWTKIGADPKEKTLLYSDGLDADVIVDLNKKYQGKMRVGFGWGTLATNDFVDCVPNNIDISPISIVSKVYAVNNVPAVKLSDNIAKATGSREMIKKMAEIFNYHETRNLKAKV
jgi:nicotinate phosphoribosyltransferase